jgi:hypothetical protein
VRSSVGRSFGGAGPQAFVGLSTEDTRKCYGVLVSRLLTLCALTISNVYPTTIDCAESEASRCLTVSVSDWTGDKDDRLRENGC